jgi:hypothetical protein
MDTNQQASDLCEGLRAIPAHEPIGSTLARFVENLSPNAITSLKQLLATAFFIRLAIRYHPRRRGKSVQVSSLVDGS